MRVTNRSVCAAIGAVLVVVALAIYPGQSNAQNSGGDEFAAIEACVYDSRTLQPIQGAIVHIQSTSAGASTQWTLSDGCIGENLFNVALFEGDYIQAQHETEGRVYTQEFRIPRRLAPDSYRWDFQLDISPRSNQGRGQRPSR